MKYYNFLYSLIYLNFLILFSADPQFNEFNGETLVILPENDIAFEMAQLFLHKTNDSVSFLLKDSISSFYSDKIINNSIQYTYNDMDSLGLPSDIFTEKIKSYNFENIVDTNASFSRFGAFLCLFCNPKVRMGFNYDNSKKYFQLLDNLNKNLALKELSMGMSSDYL